MTCTRSLLMILLAGPILLFSTSGCTHHEVEIKPVEIKPINITIDINIKVDRAMDNFFGDLDQLQNKQ